MRHTAIVVGGRKPGEDIEAYVLRARSKQEEALAAYHAAKAQLELVLGEKS